jgi:TFIIH basal transcription factor complex TTD-A subunit
MANPNPGVLIECDPSIKSIIVKIDSEKNDFIVEDLDDQTLVIKEGMLHILKMRLNEVDFPLSIPISKQDFRF